MPLRAHPNLAGTPSRHGALRLAAVASLCALGAFVAPRAVLAQDSAAADTLFREGKALVAEGKIAEACPKFEASLELDRSLGTLLNLADCLEQSGAKAAAYLRWSEAVQLADKAGDDRLAFAKERRDGLEPSIGRLSLRVTRAAEPLVVEVAGKRLGDTALGLPIVVEPGAVEVRVLRETRLLETKRVDVAAGANVEHPLDLAAIAAAHPEKKQVELGPPDPTQATIGIIGMGVGLAGLATFAVLEGVAFGQRAEATEPGGCVERGDELLCTPQGYELVNRAGDYAEVGQWVGVAGLTIFAVGLTVFLTAPTEGEPVEPGPVAIAPWFSPQGGGLVIGGRL